MLNYEMLSNEELLKMLIMEKEGENVIEELIAQFSTLPDILLDADEIELRSVKGVGSKEYSR